MQSISQIGPETKAGDTVEIPGHGVGEVQGFIPRVEGGQNIVHLLVKTETHSILVPA